MRPVLLFAFLGLAFGNVHAQKKTGTAKPVVKPAAKPAAKSQGYAISVKVTPLKNSWVYLYNYYGKYFQVADSAKLDNNSQGVFRGNKKLPGGIYILVTDRKVRLFDLLMDDAQQFSIVADTSRPENPVITGSKENTIYQDYAKFLQRTGPKLQALQQQFAAAKTKEDSTAIQQALIAGNQELQDYRENVIRDHPSSMLAAFFNTMKKPEVPKELPANPDGSKDSAYPYRFVKEHYWDDVDFADDRLVRTPFFEDKLEEYYKYYVFPEPDSIIKEVKYMLLYAREAREMYRYLLAKFTNKYINPEIMGQDKVFVYLFENHYLKGDTTILSEKDKETIFRRGWSLIANQIGEPAPALNLVNTAGKPAPLQNLQAQYTLVVFWDPNCGHCKETVPRIDSIYRAKWKGMGLKVYGVNIDENTLKAWDEFIGQHKLNEWTHVYQTKAQRDQENAAGQPNFRQLYDVYKTPTIYLLDDQKRIIAKNLDIEGFDQVLTVRQKKKTGK